MKLPITVLLVFLASIRLSAQVNTFSINFNFGNNDEAYAAIQNSTGNYVVCGMVYPGSNNFDPVIAEISTSGTILQSYTLTSATSEIFRSVVQTSDGGYLITGNVFTSVSDFNALILKLDNNFQPQFYREIVNTGINDNANRGFELAPGLYGVTGSFGLGGAVKPSYIILDEDGDIISQTFLGTNQFASPDYRGRYIGNGQVTMGHLTNAFSVLDSSGNIVKSFGNSLGIYSVDVQRLTNGNFACLSLDNYGSMTGATTSFMIVDSTCTNSIVSKKFGLNGNDVQPSEFAVDIHGNILLSGRIASLSSGNETPFLIKLDSAGNTKWMKSFLPSGASTARFNSIFPCADGGYLMAGATGPYNAQHLLLVKVDSAGNSGTCNIPGVSFTTSTPSTNTQTTHPLYSASITGNSATVTISPFTLNATVTCLTTGINENEPAKQNTIYPVPANDLVFVNSAYSGIIQTTIHDMSGRLIHSVSVKSGEPINITSLTQGCYVLSGKDENGKELFRDKIMKK